MQLTPIVSKPWILITTLKRRCILTFVLQDDHCVSSLAQKSKKEDIRFIYLYISSPLGVLAAVRAKGAIMAVATQMT